MRTIRLVGSMLALGVALPGMAAAQATADVVVNLQDMDISGFYVSSYNPSTAEVVTTTGSGALNPTMSLSIGTRYQYIYAGHLSHPFAFIAKSGSFADVVLMAQTTFFNGSMEGDAGVAWLNTSGSGMQNMYFTLTPQLADAMLQGGRTPGYRCENHPGDMRGDIVFKNVPNPYEWTGGVEPFENATLGTSVAPFFTGWAIVGGGASYTATVSDAPSGHTNQAPGSTRWMTITDTDGVNSNRVYSPGIAVTESEDAGSYMWQARVNIQSIAAGAKVRFITQHMEGPSGSASFKNFAGLEFTDSGVNVVVLGTDDGGIGRAGATTTMPVYAYTDLGGFGQNQWVTLNFSVDFEQANNLHLHCNALGSDGITVKNGMIMGFEMQGTDPDADLSRLCIRNEGAGNTSVISYDDVEFTGVSAATSARGWLLY